MMDVPGNAARNADPEDLCQAGLCNPQPAPATQSGDPSAHATRPTWVPADHNATDQVRLSVESPQSRGQRRRRRTFHNELDLRALALGKPAARVSASSSASRSTAIDRFGDLREARSYSSTSPPLIRSVDHRPATAVAQQLIGLYESGGTYISRNMLGQILRRLENSNALTLATNAVVLLLQRRLQPQPSRAGRHLHMRSYTSAISDIRSSLTASEPTLLAINMLCYYELMRGYDMQIMQHHGRGLHSLLLANPGKWARNSVGRTVLFATRLLAVEVCIAAGRPSPFEEDLWLSSTVPDSRRWDAKILSERAHEIFFKLPRLVSYLRNIRAGDTRLTTLCETAGLAHRMLRIKDDAAFRSLLSICEEHETLSETDRKIVPTSLNFEVESDFDDFLDYCRARLTIETLCLALHEIVPGYVAPQHARLRQRQLASIESVLQCWERCMETQRFGKSMCSALFQLFGALRQLDSYHGLPIDEVMSWLELKSIIAFGHLPDFAGGKDLASTWDMYCGGPPENSLYRRWVA